MKQLPVGKVEYGSNKHLMLSDGSIQKWHSYRLPPTTDGKTAGKTGKVIDIIMLWAEGSDKMTFRVRLEDKNGQGWQFEFEAET